MSKYLVCGAGGFIGGREKSPAALCRKVAQAKLQNKPEIEVWGDGNQTQSYLFIEDCLDATLKFFESDFHGPLNIGSQEQVSINQMIDLIEEISGYTVVREYNPNMPVGVKGRSSNNDKIRSELNWEPRYSLKMGLEKTYVWIESMLRNNDNQSLIFSSS